MTTGAIITARMKSIRLPGKMMIDIGGKPLLQHVVDGVKKARKLDKVIVATTVNSPEIVTYCQEHNILCYAGSENDILTRLYTSAVWQKLDVIVRVWGDSVWITGGLIDCAVAEYQVCDIDGMTYLSVKDNYSDYWVAVMSFKLLEKAYREVVDPANREWIHKYLSNPNDITGHTPRLILMDYSISAGYHTIDTKEDLERERKWYERSKATS